MDNILSDNVLRVDRVDKFYHKVHAVKNLSLSLDSGKIYGLLGPNGAGKTSLIRMITQIVLPDNGDILFKGRKMIRSDVERIGYMPEERGLYKKMKVGDHLVYLANLRGLSKDEAKRGISKWFERLEIDGWWDKKVKDLSKGMQQKIQFIATVLHDPDLIILDEPFSGLDPVNANLIRSEIGKLAKDEGKTIIFSTHRMEQVEQICEEIALVNNGEKILEGRVDEVKQNFKKGVFEYEFSRPEELEGVVVHPDLHKLSERTVSLHGHDEASAFEMLRGFISQGKSVVRFEEMLPTLNEIFIELVTTQN